MNEKRLSKKGQEVLDCLYDCKDMEEFRDNYFPEESVEDLTVAMNCFGICSSENDYMKMFLLGVKWQQAKIRKIIKTKAKDLETVVDEYLIEDKIKFIAVSELPLDNVSA